jgi:hypothetical protein
LLPHLPELGEASSGIFGLQENLKFRDKLSADAKPLLAHVRKNLQRLISQCLLIAAA